MKVLHVISSSGLYGAEAVILNLARAFSSGSHSCALAIFDNATNPNRQLYDAAVREGIETYLVPCAGQVDRSTVAAIRSVANTTKADIVHAHGYKADIYCALAFRGRPMPLVSTCHNWIDTDRLVTLYGQIDRWALRRYTSVVAVSQDVRRRLLNAGVSPNRIHIVRNGIDLRPFAAASPSLRAGFESGTLLVGLVGRLAWEKGVDIFLAAASRIHAEFPNARFVIIGEGPDRETLEAELDRLNMRSAVSFLGRRDDMPSVYASLDLMVSASRQEGLPIALLEGMASGLPIVATAVGEVPTVVREGRTGLVVPPDDPNALAAAMLELLRDPDRRARFSTAAREVIASEFSADRMSADYVRVYQEAFTAKSSPRIFMMDLWATLPYYVAYLSRALLDQGADVKVGSITYYLDPACYSSRGIRPHPGLINIVGRFRLPRFPRRILKLLESLVNLFALTLRFLVRPPDILHVQFLPMLTSRLPVDHWFVRFCRARGIHIVLTVHDLLPHDTGLTHKAAFLALYAEVDALICHSASIRDRLVAEFFVPANKISVIPHGPFFYDLPSVAEEHSLGAFNLPANQLPFLWQGILLPYKGVDLLLKAWQRVEVSSVNACLVIAGTGQPALLDQIRSQVARLNLQRVHLHFRFVSTEELVALYRAAAVVIYPYRAITTSGALATGLALGKTIVATDLPVFRELLTDRENALLVPPPSSAMNGTARSPQDSACVEALATALIELVQDPALRERLAGQVRSMNYGDESWRSIAHKTLATYQSVINHSASVSN